MPVIWQKRSKLFVAPEFVQVKVTFLGYTESLTKVETIAACAICVAPATEAIMSANIFLFTMSKLLFLRLI